jgi:hypothetical protein
MVEWMANADYEFQALTSLWCDSGVGSMSLIVLNLIELSFFEVKIRGKFLPIYYCGLSYENISCVFYLLSDFGSLRYQRGSDAEI